MDRSTSLFLDICRFSAAVVVLLSHSSGQKFTGAFLWQVGGNAGAAVMVFFVMSGYVIAYVVDVREHTLSYYVASRMARLYSVVLPALILTIICDTYGKAVNLDFYGENAVDRTSGEAILSYVTSALFLNGSWLWGELKVPGSNGPFWSMGYEGFFYVFFAVLNFSSGVRRWLGLAVLMLLAGPSVVSYFPMWLMGYGLYHGYSRVRFSLPLSTGLGLTGMAILLASPFAHATLDGITLPMLRETILTDYADAMGFSLLVVGYWRYAGVLAPVMDKLGTPIRWLASLTFALYLFHSPLVYLLSIIGPEDPASLQRRLVVFAGTAFVVVTVGRWCESQKALLRRWLLDVPTRLKA